MAGRDARAVKVDGVQRFQEPIGQLLWADEIGHVDILLETSLLSSYLAMPQAGHPEQAFRILFGYLKLHPKMRKIGLINHTLWNQRKSIPKVRLGGVL
jgi:hypothetical protein